MSDRAMQMLVSLCAEGKVPGVLAKLTKPNESDRKRAQEGWNTARYALVSSTLAKALEHGGLKWDCCSYDELVLRQGRVVQDIERFGPILHDLLLDFANAGVKDEEFREKVLDEFQEQAFHRRAVELETKS